MSEPGDAVAFKALLQQPADHVVLIADQALRITRAGAGAAALAERPETDLIGMSLIAAFGSAALDAVARQASGGSVASDEVALGRLGARQFAVDALPLPDGGILISLHEVTALRRAERVRRDFVANIGHELRTPLTSIKLLAESLASGAVDDLPTTREFATQVEREVDHVAQIVDELLDLSRIESGETRLELAPLDADEVVEDVVGRIGPVAERREIAVRIVPAPVAGVAAVGDRQRLGQALLNLAHNAVKFSHRGGEIRIGWKPGEGSVRFSVADDGIGVPDTHRERIFERFYKAERSRSRDHDGDDVSGAGLGLSIVRHIAEAHGGSVGVTSEEGVGSTFWIEIPRADAGATRPVL